MNHLFLLLTTCLLYFPLSAKPTASSDSTATAPTTVFNSYTLTTSNIGGSSAILNWTGSGTATRFDVRHRKQGSSQWITSSEIEANSFLLSDLEAGQAYEWQLLPEGSGTWLGGPASFSTVYTCSAPYVYGVYSVSATGARIEWSSSTAPQTVFVDVRLSGTSSWSTVSLSNSPSQYFYTLRGLAPTTAYNYRVRFDCSTSSNIQSFTTATCGATDLSSAATTTQATLSWQSGPYMTYALLWRQAGGAWNTAPPIVSYDYPSQRTHSLYNLTANAVYEWQLEWSCNGLPIRSAVQSFTATCAPPTSLSVTGRSTRSLNLVWNSTYRSAYSSLNLSFTFQYRPSVPAGGAWVSTSAYGSTAYPPSTYDFSGTLSNLLPETGYEVRLLTDCGSSTSAFTNPPLSTSTSNCTATATNLYVSSVTHRTASLAWSGSYQDYYAVQFRPTGVSSWSQVGPGTSTGNTYANLTNLQSATPYEWRVITYCTTPLSATTPSATQSFTTATCRTDRLTTSPPSILDFTSAYIIWNDSWPYVNNYTIRYRPVGGTNYATVTDFGGQSLVLNNLTGNTAYEWQVAAVCEAGASLSYTAPATFTTTCRQTGTSLLVRSNRITAVDLEWYNNYLGSSFPRAYQVQYRPVGGTWATQAITTNSYYPTLSLTGLSPNTTYEWGIRLECAAGVSSTITNGPSFTTSCQNSFYSINTRHVTAVKATLSFWSQQYTSAYTLRYRSTGTTSWNSLTITSNDYTLSGLSPYTTYEWQVAAQCPAGFLSDFSTAQTFTTNCYVPTDLYTNRSESSASFQWTYNQNVPSYNLQYRQQGTTSWSAVSLYNANSYLLTNINGAYEWRVQADCINGLTSDYSPTQSFTTTCQAAPNLAVSNLSSFAATASWTGAGNPASRYNLQWRPSGATSWTTETNLPAAPYTITGLNNGTSYEVRVQTQCGNAQSMYSAAVVFGSVCSPPTVLRSVYSYYTTDPGRFLQWKAVPGETYTLRWRITPPGNTVPGSWQVIPNAAPSTRFDQLSLGLYEWQVQSVCVNGSKSAFIGGTPFDVLTCHPDSITQYASNVQNTSAYVSYRALGLTQLRWRAVGAGGWNMLSHLSDYVGTSLANLAENTAYEWQVRAICPDNPNAPFGPLQTFTTSCGQPTAPTTTCIRSNQVRLSWNGPGASTYLVNWRVVGAATWSSKTVVGEASSQLTDLSDNTTYEWQVRAACSPTSSTAFAGPVTFTTGCRPPTNLTVYSSEFCYRIYANWQLCSGTTAVRMRVNYGNWSYYNTQYNWLLLGNFASGSTLEVQVQTLCGGGSTSDWSNSVYYTIPGSCPSTGTCTIPNQLWQQVGYTTASLFWSTPGTSTELRWRTSTSGWNPSAFSGGTTQGLYNLQPNTTYIWQARNACGDANDWSPAQIFTTTCAAPHLQSSPLLAGDDYIWLMYSLQGSQTYELRYRSAGGPWATIPYTSNPTKLTDLTANTLYELQIRASCTASSWTDWSASRYSTTGCPTPFQLSANQIGETSVRLDWNYNAYLISANYGRTLRYRPLGSSTWTNADLSSLGAYPPYSLTLTGLSPQTTYEWQVVYDCGSGGTSATPTQAITFRTTGTGGACAQMATIQTGLWTDAATWSCGRVPLLTDAVLIRHVVTMPGSGNATVQRVTFEGNGQVRYGGSGAMRVGQ